MKTMLFLYNPTAGKGRVTADLAAVLDVFTKAGYLTTVYPTQGKADAPRIAAELGGQFDRVVCVSDRATAYNVMAHTNCVSTGSGVLPEGFGDDRLVTVPLTGQHDMRLGYIKLRSVPLSESGREFVDILRQILRELEG